MRHLHHRRGRGLMLAEPAKARPSRHHRRINLAELACSSRCLRYSTQAIPPFSNGFPTGRRKRGRRGPLRRSLLAFYGFDAIATAAEEAKNPDRDLAIGIVGSMVLCVIIYMLVAAAAIGAVVTTRFADSAEPLALILREIDHGWAARVLGASAVIALPTVILAFFYGQSRIFFTVARDGLLPSSLARVSSRGTPVRITIFTASCVDHRRAGAAGGIAALANAGTLVAFVAVARPCSWLRVREPNRERNSPRRCHG